MGRTETRRATVASIALRDLAHLLDAPPSALEQAPRAQGSPCCFTWRSGNAAEAAQPRGASTRRPPGRCSSRARVAPRLVVVPSMGADGCRELLRNPTRCGRLGDERRLADATVPMEASRAVSGGDPSPLAQKGTLVACSDAPLPFHHALLWLGVARFEPTGRRPGCVAGGGRQHAESEAVGIRSGCAL